MNARLTINGEAREYEIGRGDRADVHLHVLPGHRVPGLAHLGRPVA